MDELSISRGELTRQKVKIKLCKSSIFLRSLIHLPLELKQAAFPFLHLSSPFSVRTCSGGVSNSFFNSSTFRILLLPNLELGHLFLGPHGHTYGGSTAKIVRFYSENRTRRRNYSPLLTVLVKARVLARFFSFGVYFYR